MGVLNDGSAFEASITRRFLFILAAYAIDEAHVETVECPCRGGLELRTTHRNLPESQRTIADPFLIECGPTLSDSYKLHTRNFHLAFMESNRHNYSGPKWLHPLHIAIVAWLGFQHTGNTEPCFTLQRIEIQPNSDSRQDFPYVPVRQSDSSSFCLWHSQVMMRREVRH